MDTYVRGDVGALVQGVTVVVLVPLLKVLPPGRARQCGHSYGYISTPARRAPLRLLQCFQFHLVVMNPQIRRLDVRLPRLALGVALHVPAAQSNTY